MYGCTVSVIQAAPAGIGATLAQLSSSFQAAGLKPSATHIVVHGTHPSRELKLYAESEDELQEWAEVLKKASGTALHDFYEMGKEIGSGAYGKVYKARNRKTGEIVAIKAVKKSRHDSENEYLEREVMILTAVNHPHVVRTTDIFDLDGKIYFAMEMLSGGELFDIISEAKHFTEAQAAEVARQIMSGIAYLHDLGIVHRDLKPENILCKSNKFPLIIKLTDFGLSNIIPMEADDASNALISFVGTPNYIAPELVSRKAYGPACDIFSAGCILYIMISGKFPFWGRNDTEYLMRLKRGVRFPDAQWAGVSEDAKDLLRQMTHWDPAKRPMAEEVLAHSWFDKLDEEDFAKSSSKINTSSIHSRYRQKEYAETLKQANEQFAL